MSNKSTAEKNESHDLESRVGRAIEVLKPDGAERDDKYHVPSLVRALQIFELMAAEPAALGISDIAARLGLPKNSVFRIVTTLTDYGYLSRDPHQKTYALTRRLLALGYAAIDESNLVDKALGPMRALRDATGETVLLATLSGTQGVVLEQAPSPQPIKVMVEIGHQFPLHTAAPAKAMLAFLEPTEREALVEQIQFVRYTDNTILDRAAYRLELERVRETGYALDRGEEVEEIHCIAAPVLGRRGRPVAAIWVTGPRTRLKETKFERVRQMVMEQAQIISQRLGQISTTEKNTLGEAVDR